MYKFILVFLLFYISCHKVNEGNTDIGSSNMAVTELTAPPMSSSSPLVKTSDNNSINLNTYERKIIKNAFLTFESDKPEENIRIITRLVSKHHGYIISNNQSKLDNLTEYRINFKIPFQQFDAVLLDIEKNGGTLLNKNVSSEDVTEEFIDNESQLKAQKELEIRYLQLIKQAKTIKDMLEIEAKLSEVRANIERIEGRQRFLDNNTQYSQFEITILDKDSTVSNNYLTKLKNSFQDGWNHIFNSILWLIEMLPFILLIGIIYYVLRKKNISLNIFKKKKE